jgi:hypothetical protein
MDDLITLTDVGKIPKRDEKEIADMTFLEAMKEMLTSSQNLDSNMPNATRRSLFASLSTCMNADLEQSDMAKRPEIMLDLQAAEGEIQRNTLAIEENKQIMKELSEQMRNEFERDGDPKAIATMKAVFDDTDRALNGYVLMLDAARETADFKIKQLEDMDLRAKFPETLALVCTTLSENSEPFKGVRISSEECNEAKRMLFHQAGLNLAESEIAALIPDSDLNNSLSQSYLALSAIYNLVKDGFKFNAANASIIDKYMKQFPDKVKETPLHQEIRYVNTVLNAGLSPIILGEIVGKPLSGMVRQLLDYRSTQQLNSGLRYRDIENMVGDRRKLLDILVDNITDDEDRKSLKVMKPKRDESNDSFATLSEIGTTSS